MLVEGKEFPTIFGSEGGVSTTQSTTATPTTTSSTPAGDKKRSGKEKGKDKETLKSKKELRCWQRTEKILDTKMTENYGRYGHTSFTTDNMVYTIGGGDATGEYVTNMLCFSIGNRINPDRN